MKEKDYGVGVRGFLAEEQGAGHYLCLLALTARWFLLTPVLVILTVMIIITANTH